MSVTASIMVDFSTVGSDAYITAELDAEKNMDKTTFQPGDDVYFKVYSDVSYTVESTSGKTIKEESKTESDTIKEVIAFPNTKTANTQGLIKEGTASIIWYGTSGGSIDQTGTTEISISAKALAVGLLEYKSEYDLWKLSPPSSMPDTYAILILITAA